MTRRSACRTATTACKATPELLAALSHLTPGSIGMRLQNVEYLATGGARGLSGVATQTREIWTLVQAHATRAEHPGAMLAEHTPDLSALSESGLFLCTGPFCVSRGAGA